MALIHNDGKSQIHTFDFGAAVVSDVPWINCLDFNSVTAVAELLLAGDEVELRGLGGDPNQDPAPLSTEIGFQLGLTITDNGAVRTDILPTFVKLIKTANVGGGATTGEIILRKMMV